MAAVGLLGLFVLAHLLRNHCVDLNQAWSECSPQCLVVQVPNKSDSLTNMAAISHLGFFFRKLTIESLNFIKYWASLK